MNKKLLFLAITLIVQHVYTMETNTEKKTSIIQKAQNGDLQSMHILFYNTFNNAQNAEVPIKHRTNALKQANYWFEKISKSLEIQRANEHGE